MTEKIKARELRKGDVLEGLNNTTLLVVDVSRSLTWDGPVDNAPVIADFGPHGSWCYHATETVSVVRRAESDNPKPVLVFRDEPALKTVPADGDVLPYEVADQDASYQCVMRHDGQPTTGVIGWAEHEHSDTYGRDLIDLQWVPFFEIQLPGDDEPTRFCEDCAGWLTALAPHLLEG